MVQAAVNIGWFKFMTGSMGESYFDSLAISAAGLLVTSLRCSAQVLHVAQRTDHLIRLHAPVLFAFEVVILECENVFLGDRIGRTVAHGFEP